MAKRWKNRPEGSTWGDWGDDDQLGRLNLLTPEKIWQGLMEVKEGRAFCLSLPLDYPGGNALNARRFPPVLSPTGDASEPRFNFPTSKLDPHYTDIVSDDRVLLTLQYSTQWDTLAHVGSMFDADGDGKPEPVYYNGWRAGKDVVGPHDYGHGAKPDSPPSANKLGVENMAVKAIQGRGVLVDLEKHYGRDHIHVGYDELMRVIEADKVVVETGDMLLLHTGFATMILEMNKQPDPKKLHAACAVLNGRDKKLLQWITDSGIACLIADNYGVEAVPSLPGGEEHHAWLPLHEHCLFKLGCNLGELWYLDELAHFLRPRKRSRFLLTAPPLRLPGAVGSPATPVATV
jgi:kynurenine formamidase